MCVLVVDDSDRLRDVIRSVVEATPGFEVAGLASSGGEAVALMDALAPELVLLDAEMPGMDGIETAARIRDRYPSVVILLLTNSPPTTSRIRSLTFESKRDFSSERLADFWRQRGKRSGDAPLGA